VRTLRWLLVLVALLLVVVPLLSGLHLGGGSSGGSAGRDAPSGVGGGTARVVRVVDGDTILVAQGGREDRVRYIGIDTPETVKPGTPVQCFGHQASAENTRLVAGATVRLQVGAEARDRYGRLLAYVSRGGTSVNEALLRGGFARTLTIPPNDRYAQRFAGIQAAARAARRGLWGACS
jgi:micrococcal nuclease